MDKQSSIDSVLATGMERARRGTATSHRTWSVIRNVCGSDFWSITYDYSQFVFVCITVDHVSHGCVVTDKGATERFSDFEVRMEPLTFHNYSMLHCPAGSVCVKLCVKNPVR